MTSDTEAIHELVSLFACRLLARDIDGLMALMTDDVVFMPTSGGGPVEPAYVGAPAVRRLLEHLVDAMDIGITPTVAEVEVLGDVAWARDTYVETTHVHDGPTLDITGAEMMILRRVDDSWRFARYIFSIASSRARATR